MQSYDRERDRKSLQDLAKMAQGLTPPPSSVAAFSPVPSTRSVTSLPSSSKADDSGIVDLAAASAADPQAAMRAQTTPLGNQSLFDNSPPPPPVNAPPASYVPAHAYQQPAPSVPPPSVGSVPPPAPYASVHPIGPSLHKKKSGAGALVFAFGSIIAIGAAAAGGFLYIRSHKPVTPSVAVAAPVAETPAIVAQNTMPADPAPVATPDKPSDGAMDLSTLPNANTTSKSTGQRVAVRTSAKPAAKEPVEKAAPVEDPAVAKAEKAKLDKALAGNSTPAAPAPQAGAPGDLGAGLREAVGGQGKMATEQKPAAGSSGSGANLPQKPSQGAVTGALGAVLPAARECLGPDDPISKASVVFNSDGSVYGVTVSGGAAGKPAATCIEKELKKAKLAPFAEQSYTANITIRHN